MARALRYAPRPTTLNEVRGGGVWGSGETFWELLGVFCYLSWVPPDRVPSPFWSTIAPASGETCWRRPRWRLHDCSRTPGSGFDGSTATKPTPAGDVCCAMNSCCTLFLAGKLRASSCSEKHFSARTAAVSTATFSSIGSSLL